MKIVCFDFDDTLCFTPTPENGKKEYKEKTGKDWSFIGWWGRSESLDIEVFDIKLNQWVYKKYLEAISDDNNYVIMTTGRIVELEKEVVKILNKYNLSFEEILLNDKDDTFYFKTSNFEKLINELKPDEFIMYDDRQEHLPRFEKWAEKQNCDITIVDVVNKKVNKIKNN